MKKMLVLSMVVLLLLSLSLPAFGAKAPKAHLASITLTGEATVMVNEEITLTAVTLKEGSNYAEEWTGAVAESFVLNDEGYYISTAKFAAETAGTYNVTYNVVMGAGKSGVTFAGVRTLTIVVVDPQTNPDQVTVVDFSIADYEFTLLNNDKFHLTITALDVTYSDGTNEVVEVELSAGNFDPERNRNFDLNYGGVSKQFNMTAPASE